MLLECVDVECKPSDILFMGGKDSPSGVGRGPTGIALKRGRFSILSSRRGSPNPARAQLTFDSNFLSSSTKNSFLNQMIYQNIFNFISKNSHLEPG